MNTHRAIIETSVPPGVELVGAGDFDFCVTSLDTWLAKHPLNGWQKGLVVEVVYARMPAEGAREPEEQT